MVANPADDFSDLDAAGVHNAAVLELATDGVMARTGCGSGKLCPNEPIQRWEMAVWLVRALDGGDPRRVSRSRFEDVDRWQWWARHAERMAQLGVTRGCSAEPLRYCPDDPVTRAQMASFLVRAYQLGRATPAGFDDTGGSVHEVDIDALFAARITVGCSTEPLRYCPRLPTTRGEMATFITRARARQ